MKQFLFPKIARCGEGRHISPTLHRDRVLPWHFGILLLLTCLPFTAQVSAQNDTPCECSQRWTEGAAWNPNGTVNESPGPQPKGIIRCSGTPDMQANISTQFGCIYNAASFPITIMACTDPITGAVIPPPTPPHPNNPIVWLNFDVRPNVGTFQVQINEDNMMDDIGWALYYSATPTSSAGPPPHYQSGDCNNLIFYLCGQASNNTWQTFTVPNFTQPTNWYLAVWDQDDDNTLLIEDIQGRYGCGNGDLYCDLEVGTQTTTCNGNGTYTVMIPIVGQNGNYVGTDPNALNAPSTPVCLSNTGAGGATGGIISLNYTYGVNYNINIGIDVTDPCVDPLNPTACTANISGSAPNCCTPPPSCMITGPTSVCPDATGIMYTGPPGMTGYLWTITGNGSINGSATGQTVSVTSDGTCGGTYMLSLQVTQVNCMNQCMIDVTVSDNTSPIATCPTSTTLSACVTQANLTNAFNIWQAGFTATDNCTTTSFPPVTGLTPPSICGGTTSHTYIVTDDCNNTGTCSSSFTVTAAPNVVLTCPINTTAAACQSQADINTNFAAWLATASASGGCNGVFTNNNTGAPPACGGSTTVTFTYTSSCAPLTSTCQATYTVAAPPTIVLTCPVNTTTPACQTQAAVNTAFANWLATASASGGCNGVLTNNSTTAPPACGGSTTVTFTYTSSCAPTTTTCQATFTVAAPPTVVLSCPINTTTAACQTQAGVNTAFATWLATASANGGCGGVLTNDNTGAPPACGGSTTVTFTYTSTCAPLTTTCQATFTVPASPNVVLTCPANTTAAACQTQAAVNTAFATWLATASASGGCNGVLTDNNTGAPPACGGSTTVTFTYTSTCAPLTTTCQATFTVPASPNVTLTCPMNLTTAACQTQAQVNTDFANWLATAGGSGGCNGVLTNNNTGAPSACGGSTTVTFTYTSTCAPLTTTCQATFTVPAPPTVMLTCPTNTTAAACQTQAAVNTAFATWLATASASGGCNGVLTNNNTGAPPACGGSTTVTFTYTSTCAPLTTTCQATFTVAAAPAVVLTCPTNTTTAACQTQAAVNTAFATWLATASATGGCNGVLTNNNTGAPPACGGSTTVTFTYTSSACSAPTTTCQATFTVAAPPTIMLNCPVNTTVVSCQTQTDVNTAFAAWLSTASATGGCNGVLTNNNTGAPPACGGSTTVTFTYTSGCAPITTTCQATFTVTSSQNVVLNCPASTTTAACQTQATVNSAFATWLATASASGGCNGVLTNNNTGAPSACGGSTTVIFTYTSSACSAATTTCSATFTVAAPPTVALNCPANTTTAFGQTQAQVNTAFATWLATANGMGGCNGVLTNNNTGAPPAAGGSTTVTFTYTSSCAPTTTTCQATFTVAPVPMVVLNCPMNTSTAACQTQAAVNTAFATWLATASASGGCNGVLTNNNTGAPSSCGGSTTVTFTYTSTCAPLTTTCQATFTVLAPPTVMLTCPANTTTAACQTQAAVNTAFATWLATATASGGCSGVLTNNNTGAPPACGGSTTVTFTYTSTCAPLTTTCQATFTVAAPQNVVLNCPANTTTAACQSQAALDASFAAWLATASATGGCNGVLTNNNTGAPSICGGTTTVTFTYTSSCTPTTTTCTATFTVPAQPAIVLNCPINTTVVSCQTQAAVNTSFAAWLATASAMGGCNGVLTNNNTGAPPACGGSTTVTFTYTSSCAPLTTTCQATFTVTAAQNVVLTCPTNTTTAACQTQAAVNTAFTAWLATASASGGCNGVLTNNNTGAPPACGGSTTVTFTYTSSACSAATTTCQATFTVPAAPTVVLTCPSNTTIAACQTQAQVNTAFAAWVASASATGGCNGVLTNNNTGAPSICGGSTTVTFTYTSSCSPTTTTCNATFTVPVQPTVVLTCPANTTTAACQTQASVNTAFASWLATASATGGCNGVLTNNNTGAPPACGGSTTVTFTYTSSCAPTTTTCQATFTVPAAPTVVLNCPANMTTGTCMLQSAVNSAFNTWLASVSVTGGCNGVLTNNSTGAPSKCGGSTTVTFTYTSTCAPFTTTCQATFTVPASPPVVLNCPANTTTMACQTQAAVDAAYNTWLGTVSASGGCNGILSNNSTGAPPACGGSKTVTFTYISACAPITTTCQATFTVPPSPNVVLTCPVNTTTMGCQTQAQVNTAFAAWLATATATGGCNGVLTNNNAGAPSACGGSTTVTFTYSSSCAPLTTTCQATFTVPASPNVVLTCPGNTTAAACQTQAAINTAFANWLATASASGGCNGVLTNNSTVAPSACGGSTTVIFTYTSTCAPLTTTCQATFTVTAPQPLALTCPVNTTTAACQTQAAVDAAYNTWLATASASGGCSGVLTNNSTGAPSACGGSKTVIFTYTSAACAPLTTACQATFTVPAAPPIVLNCPTNMTTAGGQSQAAVNAAFATWLATASGSGGCNGALSNNNTGAPPFTGGSTTVTFTYSSSCAPLTTTCQATFTVPAIPVVTLTCPTSTTVAACQTQANVNAAFAAWLASANGTGGCNGVLTNNNTGAPSACGGTTTVTFTYTSTCGTLVTTCQATFTVTASPAVTLTCPLNMTTAVGLTQPAINTAFTNWLNTASAAGGCNAVLSNNNTGAPPATGGSTTVTFTYTSTCSPLTTTCLTTFTVPTPAPIVLNCPMSTTTASCQTQAQVNAAFSAWLATASASGGCGGVLTNNNTGAPPICGGSTTVTFTYTSGCFAPTTTCEATFTVTAPTPVVLTCPTTTTVAACQSQAAVNTAFAAWLATASASGGCNGVLTNNNTGAPSACGGSTTVTFTYTSSCAPLTTTCQATFNVPAAPTVVLTCPTNTTTPACQTQAQVNAAFTAWLATANGTGGCGGALLNNNTGAPPACGGSTTVTFTYTSTCSPLATTCQATFTVAAPTVVLTCPVNTTTPACQTQAAVDAAYANWLATATASGACGGVLTNNNTGAPPACGGSKTVTFTYTSTCAPLTTTCQATFTVASAPLVLNAPANQAEAACQTQAAIDAKYATWLASATTTGGCGVVISNNSTGAPSACGGSKDVIFTATSNCAAPINQTKTFLVTAAPTLTLNCPNDRTESGCQTQAQINTKFNAWLAQATVTGGCNATISTSMAAAPSACGGSVSVTFTANSTCGSSTSCTKTFTVTSATTPVLTCPSPMTVGPNLTQSQINAAFQTWLATATITGGCPGALTNDNLGAPSVCGGATTVTFTYTSPCSALPITCSQTFTVTSLPPSIASSKYFAGIESATSGIPGHFDVITEIVVQNDGSANLSNLSVIDNLGSVSNFGSAFVSVTQAPQIVSTGAAGVTTTATALPTVNAAYNGTGDLLTGGGLLETDQRVVIRFRVEINPNAPGSPSVLRNQATVFGTIANCSPAAVISDLTDAGPFPRTSNTGWPGDTGGKDDPSLLQRCWEELDEGLACNDLVQVSLNQNCEIWLNPTMVLEGESSGCTNPTFFPLGYYYEVFMVTDAWDVPVPDLNPATPNIHEISGSYIGQTLTVKIKDKLYGNSCWGYIQIEDKTGPVFTCPSTPIEVACSADLNAIPAPVAVDNCDPNPIVALLSQQTIDNDICDGTYVIRRIYKATDNQGKSSLVNCTQTINVVRPPIDFPDDISWSCTQYASKPNIINATGLHPSITDTDPVEPGIDVSTGLSQAILTATGSGTVNVSNNNSICGYNVLHSDQTVGICGNGFKILRTWTVVDWCTGSIITTGVGGEDNIQIIKVMDKVAPNITRPPFQVSANVQATQSQPCRSTGLLLPPTVLTDDCSAITVQISTPVGPAIMNPNNSGTIPAPGLPLGTHSITYTATDACNNSRSITVAVTVVDDISPTTVCNGVIEVDLPSNPGATATVLANLFDNGSTDNCCLHHFEVRRMTDPCDDGHNDTQFGSSVVFCCEDVPGLPVMVVVRAFDCHGNYNDCMVEVDVNDKLAPALATCPGNQRITCDVFVNTYEAGLNLATSPAAKSQYLDAAFGQPVFADNCGSITLNRSYSSNLTPCKEGVITRTWTATDAGGLTSPTSCTQYISVDHVSDFAVSFPADLTINCGQALPDFGEPTIFRETCELIAITHDDGPFEVVPGACYKVVRTWQVVNWCVQGTSLDQEVVEVPESALGGPISQCDVDGDGDCDSRTFRDSWTLNQRPSAANATDPTGPDTDLDSDPWDGVIIYKQTVHIVDAVNPVIPNCSIPVVCIDGPTCTANFTIPMPTVTDCSSQLTVTATTVGLGNGFGPFNSGPGTFTTVFTANDGCGNSASCSATLTIRDCKAPSAACNPGISVPLMPGTPPMVPVNASQLNAGSTDNCTSNLIFSFTPDPTTTSQVFTCDNEGVNPVQIYVTDAAGNQSFCSTTVTILDNTTSCMDDTLVVNVGGFILNEDNDPVGNVSVNLSGQSIGNASTSANGGFTITGVQVGNDVSIVPSHDVNPLQGVSTYDMVLISQHILNMNLLDSPYKLIAADVNNSKTITTFDLVELRKLILLMTNDFSNNTSWRFVERSYQFPDPDNPWLETFPEFININNIPNDVLNADFVAVKIGDVNNSSALIGSNPDERDAQALVFQAREQQLEPGETYEVSFDAMQEGTEGYQFTLEFNPDMVEFIEVGEGRATAANFGLSKMDENALTASWNQFGENEGEAKPYFTLVFKAKTAGRISEALWLSDRFIRTEAYSREGGSQQVRLLFLGNEVVTGFELFQNRPNPFNSETLISFTLPKAGDATLTIMDASGRLVKTINGQYQAGYNEIRIQKEELGIREGILYYRLSSGTNTASKMMLLAD